MAKCRCESSAHVACVSRSGPLTNSRNRNFRVAISPLLLRSRTLKSGTRDKCDPKIFTNILHKQMRHKNFHMRAQSAPYGAIFPKTVAYAKYDRASSNLSFTPRFFHSTGAITCPFRNICSKNTPRTTNIRSPNFGPYSRPFLPMRSGNMRDALCHGCNNMVACCGIISSGTLPSSSNYEAPVPRFV